MFEKAPIYFQNSISSLESRSGVPRRIFFFFSIRFVSRILRSTVIDYVWLYGDFTTVSSKSSFKMLTAWRSSRKRIKMKNGFFNRIIYTLTRNTRVILRVWEIEWLSSLSITIKGRFLLGRCLRKMLHLRFEIRFFGRISTTTTFIISQRIQFCRTCRLDPLIIALVEKP